MLTDLSTVLPTLTSGVALADRSTGGRLAITGNDRLRFLHNQTTNTFQFRKPGEGCLTTFVTSTARTLDLARALIGEDEVLLLLSPQRYQFLLTWLDRYIFPADQVILQDVTPETACVVVLGERSSALLTTLGLTDLPTREHDRCRTTLAGIPIQIAAGSGLTDPGYTIVTAADQADALKQVLLNPPLSESDLVPIVLDDRAWEMLRILRGCPVPDAELTEEYNPLEAGLWQTLSFDKGCYIGQETIARLNTYKGVKQRLWGIQLQGAAEPGTLIVNETNEKIGRLTSVTATPQGYFGLGYIRTKAGGIGSGIHLQQSEPVTGTIVSVPFLHHPNNELTESC